MHSNHWQRKRPFRPSIGDEIIEYAVINSKALRDRHYVDRLNAIAQIPPSGRRLKVIYKKLAKDKIRVITAFWLD